MSRREDRPLISLVVPFFNEQEMVARFHQSVREVLCSENCDLQFVYVNDGSTDETLSLLIEASRVDRDILVLDLSRNFGKEAALSAGIDAAKGDALILMDADLQDPPALLSTFLELWRNGYRVVYGVRTTRSGDPVAKRLTARFFYRIFNLFSATPVPVDAGDFRLIDRRVADVLRAMPERNRFMKGLFAWAGFNAIEVPYERVERAAGATKWGYWRLWNLALDGFSSFSTVPLRVWTYLGFGASLLAFLYGSLIIVRTLVVGVDLPGYASLMTVILFLGGLQLMSIGVIGEYIGRVLLESKQRPLYVLNRAIRGGDDLPRYAIGAAGADADSSR